MSAAVLRRLLAATVVVGLAAAVTGVLAQRVGDDVDWDDNDYYDVGRDPSKIALLENVERNHLGPDNFFKKYSAGRYSEAVGDLDYVLWVFPNHPRALHYIMSCARVMRQPSLPMTRFQTAIRKYPQHAFTHAQYGKYLTEIHQLPGAVESLKHALELDPELAPAHAWLADAYYELGEVESARTHERQARTLGWRGAIGERKGPSPAPPEDPE